MGIGTVVEDFWDLHISYENASHALKYRFFFPHKNIFDAREALGREFSLFSFSESKEEELIRLLCQKNAPAIEEWLRKVNGYANKLLLPRFAKSAFDEFSTPAARKYFVDKKEASAGNFADLLAHSDGLIKNISDDLRALDKLIVKPNAVNGELSEDDIQLFPLLRNLTLVAGINWPSRVADYRDNMAKQTQINLLSSMAI